MDDAEIIEIAKWAWRIEQNGENRIGKGRQQMEKLMMASSDAFVLEWLLRGQHWDGGPFTIPNDMRERMPEGGWSRPRFVEARDVLLQFRRIEMVRNHSSKTGPALFRWGKS
jgi:hypothetical protein